MATNSYQNTQHARVMNSTYKSKYRKMKLLIKNMIFENAALCDEVAQVQADLLTAREERRFLIKRLMRHEGIDNLEQLEMDQQQNLAETNQADKPLPKKRGPKKRLQIGNNENPTPKMRDKIVIDSKNKPVYPINLYNIMVHSPGEIIPINPNFHNAHWIYPVGYVATRIYAHPKDPQRKCVFTCKILNNAGTPQFQIIPDNDLDSVFFGESANVCHQGLLETLQRSLSSVVKLPIHVQGEKFFGLSNPTVRSLLQLDTGFKQCANFEGFLSQNSIELSDEKDPTMSFEALQSLIAMSAYHTIEDLKEEPPDELLNFN